MDPRIRIKQGQYLNTFMFVADQILIQDNQDKLQNPTDTLYSKGEMYSFKISNKKTKVAMFKGEFPVNNY